MHFGAYDEVRFGRTYSNFGFCNRFVHVDGSLHGSCEQHYLRALFGHGSRPWASEKGLTLGSSPFAFFAWQQSVL